MQGSHECNVGARVTKLFEERGRPETNLVALRKYLTSKKVPAWDKSLVMQYGYRTMPTGAWLAKHGWETDGRCPQCGVLDDVYHRLQGCQAAEISQLACTKAYVDSAWDKVPVPERPEREERWTYRIEGKEVSQEDFSFQPEANIFVDGSGYYTQWKEIAIAGVAGIQIHNGICRLMQLSLPKEFPQQANTAEHIGLLGASTHLKGNKAEVVSDCMGVVNGFTKHKQEVLQYKGHNAGFWSQVEYAAVLGGH